MRTARAVMAAAILLAFSVSSALPLRSIATGYRVEWPTYKYGMARTGFFNVHTLYRPFRYKDFKVAWKVKTQLCISSSPAVGDLNGDGRPEVAFSSCDGHLYVVDGSTGRVLWNSTTGGGFASPTIWDLDGDGKPEIVTLGASGVIYAFDGWGRELWEVAGTFIRGSPAVDDVDGDAKYEVLAPSFDGNLYVIDYRGHVIYKIRVGDYPVSTPAVADVNGDGRGDAIVVDGSSLILVLFKPGGYNVYHIDLGESLVGPPALQDLTGDGRPDAVVVSQDCGVFLVDLEGGRVVASTHLPGASECYSPPSVGDVDGDGLPDIVVGSMQGLYILSRNLSVEYRFPEIRVYTSSPIIADVDGDGRNEVIIGQESGELDIIDVSLAGEPYQEIQWFLITGGPIMGSAAVADVDGDGAPEILIGSRDFNLYCIKGVEAATATSTATHTPAMTATATSTGASQASRAVPGLSPGPASPGVRVRWGIIAGALAAAVIIVVAAALYSRS